MNPRLTLPWCHDSPSYVDLISHMKVQEILLLLIEKGVFEHTPHSRGGADSEQASGEKGAEGGALSCRVQRGEKAGCTLMVYKITGRPVTECGSQGVQRKVEGGDGVVSGIGRSLRVSNDG
jgi:hypothetical protein